MSDHHDTDGSGALASGPSGEPQGSCPRHPTFDRACLNCRQCAREREQWLGREVEEEQKQADGETMEWFWKARPVLSHIRDFARSRRAGPWSVFSGVCSRAVVATEPNIVIPPVVGSDKSLNLFVAMVSPSGGGKGISDDVAAEAVTFVNGSGQPILIESFSVGSGEGIAKTFQPGKGDEEGRRTRALFVAAEVDTLAALGGRQGATLWPELRKAYSGEQIGFANAGRDTRSTLAAHSYRMCLVVGVQPLRAAALLDDAHGGTPQRFAWFKSTDPDAPDEDVPEPPPMKVRVRAFSAERVPMAVPDVAYAEIRRHRLAVLREQEGVDPLDGHRMLTRLKFAAALAILDERHDINAEDWHLAGAVLRLSDRTRAGVQRAAAKQARSSNQARALATAERNEFAAEYAEQRSRERVWKSVFRYLDRRTVATRRELRVNLHSPLRGMFDAEIEELESAGHVTFDGSVYRRAEGEGGGTSSTPVPPL